MTFGNCVAHPTLVAQVSGHLLGPTNTFYDPLTGMEGNHVRFLVLGKRGEYLVQAISHSNLPSRYYSPTALAWKASRLITMHVHPLAPDTHVLLSLESWGPRSTDVWAVAMRWTRQMPMRCTSSGEAGIPKLVPLGSCMFGPKRDRALW
jgi:hypothetical protein